MINHHHSTFTTYTTLLNITSTAPKLRSRRRSVFILQSCYSFHHTTSLAPSSAPDTHILTSSSMMAFASTFTPAAASLSTTRCQHQPTKRTCACQQAQRSSSTTRIQPHRRKLPQLACSAAAAAHRIQQTPAPHLAVPRRHAWSRARHSHVAKAAAAAGASAPSPSDGQAVGSWLTKVVLPTALVLMVCNMDRICLSVAILPMAQEYGWPATVQV